MNSIERLAIIFCCYFVVPAYAAQPISAEATMDELVFFGKITPDAVAKFITRYSDSKNLVLTIFSEGGDMDSAITLGEWVRSKGLSVRVKTFCFSACANFVFPAGKTKFIEPGALVMWHGSMEQKDLLEGIKYFDYVNQKKQSDLQLSDSDRDFLYRETVKWTVAKRVLGRQRKFYREIGINEYITRLGQEPIRYPVDGWVATTRLMDYMGIKGIIAPLDYGSSSYVAKNVLAKMVVKNTPLVFDLDDDNTPFLIK